MIHSFTIGRSLRRFVFNTKAQAPIPAAIAMTNKTRDVIRRTNSLIKKMNFSQRVVLSGRNMQSVRTNIFSNLKSRRETGSIINATAIAACRECSFRCKIRTNYLDLKRTLRHLERNSKSSIGNHLVNFPGHSMNERMKDVRQFRSRYEGTLCWENKLMFILQSESPVFFLQSESPMIVMIALIVKYFSSISFNCG